MSAPSPPSTSHVVPEPSTSRPLSRQRRFIRSEASILGYHILVEQRSNGTGRRHSTYWVTAFQHRPPSRLEALAPPQTAPDPAPVPARVPVLQQGRHPKVEYRPLISPDPPQDAARDGSRRRTPAADAHFPRAPRTLTSSAAPTPHCTSLRSHPPPLLEPRPGQPAHHDGGRETLGPRPGGREGWAWPALTPKHWRISREDFYSRGRTAFCVPSPGTPAPTAISRSWAAVSPRPEPEHNKNALACSSRAHCTGCASARHCGSSASSSSCFACSASPHLRDTPAPAACVIGFAGSIFAC